MLLLFLLLSSAQAQTTHEPAGQKVLGDIHFGPTNLPLKWTSAPIPQSGVVTGKVYMRSPKAWATPDEPGAQGWGNRVTFKQGLTAGVGPGGLLLVKEDLPKNTDSHSDHSYTTWYERGAIRFGNLDAAGNIKPCFESSNTSGLKLLGYWGQGRPGSTNPTQVIGWANTYPTNITGVGKCIQNWVFEIRTQGAALKNTNYTQNRSNGTGVPFYISAGPTWHTYEILFVSNSSTTVKDGSLQMWVDGTLVMLHKNIGWRDAANPRGFFGKHWNPVQGGGCPSTGPNPCPRTETGVLDYGDVYISVGGQID